jgi:tetratricopeptide (TPR) repeat protein
LVLPVEAKEVVDPIIDLAIKRNYKRRVSQINLIFGLYYHTVDENYPKAIEYYEKALKIGEELNDILTLVLANNLMGVCLSDNGEFAKALPYAEKALKINVMANVLWGIVAIKTNMVNWPYLRQGKVELAYQTGIEALRIADESGDINSKGLANLALGISYYFKGYLEEAEELLLKSVEFLQKSNQLVYGAGANGYLGKTYIAMGKYKISQEYHEKSTSLYRGCNCLPSFIIWNKIAVVLAKIMNNEKDINLNEILKWHKEIKNKWVKGWALNIIGEILLNIDDQHISEAEDWIKRSIETNQKYGMMWLLATDYALYSELFTQKEDLSKARENLGKAIEIFKECGADGWVEKYEKELVAL